MELDIEKAYGQMNWSFLLGILRRWGLEGNGLDG